MILKVLIGSCSPRLGLDHLKLKVQWVVRGPLAEKKVSVKEMKEGYH